MEISTPALLNIVLAFSIALNISLAIKFSFIHYGNNTKRSFKNKLHSSGIQINGDHNQIIQQIKDVAENPYNEAVLEIEKKNSAFEKNEQDLQKYLSGLEPQPADSALAEIKTGFTDLDSIITIEPGQLTALVGLPGSGKSTLVLDIGRYNAVRKIPVLYFSLNTKTLPLIDRLLSAEARISLTNLKKGTLSSNTDFSKLQESIERISDAPIFIDDTPYATIQDLCGRITSVGEKMKQGLLVIDGVELLDEYTYDPQLVLVQLKRQASLFNIPILLTAPLPRDPAAHRGGSIRITDLPEAFAQIPDSVIAINHQYFEEPNVARISLLKNRHGECSSLELYHDFTFMTFLNLESKKMEADEDF